MTHSLLNDCLILFRKPEYPQSIVEYFETVNVRTFNPIFTSLMEPKDAADTVLFILCAYSEESPMIISRQDSTEEKIQICEYLGIEESRREYLIFLRDQQAKQCVTNYIVQFCGEEFRNLMMMKIELADYTYDIANRNFRTSEIKATGDEKEPTKIEYFYDQKEHNKAVMERTKLAKMIETTEKTLFQKAKRMGITDLDDWKRKGGAGGKMNKRSGAPERLITNKK